MTDDPRLEQIRRILERTPASAAPRSENMREAAVALVLRPRDRLELLLIKRAEHEHDPWSGHIALPGGRRAAADSDLYATALRETEEEVGIPAARIATRLGLLDEVAPANPRLPSIVIAPYVVGVPPDTAAIADPREVDAAMWVPVDSLREPGAVSEFVLELEGVRRKFPSFTWGEHVIWGLTHRILTRFISLLDAAGV